MRDTHFDSDQHPIDSLAEEFAQRCRSGGCPSITQYSQQYPELADEIREVFPAIAMMEQLSRKEETIRADSRRLVEINRHMVDRLGDYRIVRVIGRGGMGIVYEAVQESLGRTVAVKVLTANIVNQPKHLKRFVREAQAAAMLHHTNIVPVFGVGHDNDLHYYVMQYIDGVGFDQLIDQRRRQAVNGTDATPAESRATAQSSGTSPAPRGSAGTTTGTHFSWRQIAEYGVQISRAVDYAHRQGILHRDIKPANLLVDTHGTVWVTDFGLAKVFGDEGLTQSGDVFGTVRYMAPEQFEGRSDEASDIYSVGLTLYELATLQPAFREEDTKKLMLRITQQGVPHPRVISPSIPLDLETIILKASAFDPPHRYATAGELAEDLRRFLDGEPIIARRTSTLRRMWRWSRRNPALAALSGLSLLLLLLVAIVASVGYVHVDQAREKAIGLATRERRQSEELRAANRKVTEETEHARREFQRAEDNLQLAMRAFDDVIDRISGRGLPESLELELSEDSPRTSPAIATGDDAELLQSLLAFYQEFAQRNQADAGVQLETAKAHHCIGDIRQRLGQYDMAVAAYGEALRIYRGMADKGAPDLPLLLAMVEVSNQRGVTLAKAGRTRDAIDAHLLARDMLANQETSRTLSNECRFALAETYNHLGAIRSRNDATALPFITRGGPGRKGAGAGAGPLRLNAASRIEDYHQSALAILEQLLAQDPTNAQYRLALARCHRNCLPRVWREGQAAEVATSLQTSVAILEQLAADFPATPRYSFELADVLSIDTPALWETDFGKEGRQRLERAERISRTLNSTYPHQPEYEILHANALYRLGLILRRHGQAELAMAHLAEAAKRMQELSERLPDVPVYVASLSQITDDLGTLQREAGLLDESRETLENGILHLVATYDPQGDMRTARRWVATLYSNLHRTLAAARP